MSPTNYLCTDRYTSKCFTTLPLTVFAQSNSVADFLRDTEPKTGIKRSLCVFRPPLGGLEAGYDVHLRLIGKPVVDFLLVIIELFSLAVMLVELRANIDWKAPF